MSSQATQVTHLTAYVNGSSSCISVPFISEVHKAHSLDSILAFCPAFCLFLYFSIFLEAHKAHTHCLILDLSFPHLAHPQKSFLPSNDPTLFWRRTRHTIMTNTCLINSSLHFRGTQGAHTKLLPVL